MDTSQPAISEDVDLATRAHGNKLARSLAFGAGALLTPVVIAGGVHALTRSRRATWIAGAASAIAAATLRAQLQRWFTDEPVYIVEGRIGDLELRRYAPRVEAHTRVAAPDFEAALEDGYERLASYIAGANDASERLARTTPVMIKPRATTHTIAFVMPPERAVSTLPGPRDERITLVQNIERRVAVLRYHGRYTNEMFQKQTRRLHELVAAADLDTRGEPMFAGFDPPTTLPWLRRSELWIELA